MKSIKTCIVHSDSKTAFNVTATTIGDKYKICRVPYTVDETDILFTNRSKNEARQHAEFISSCFNNYDEISKLLDSLSKAQK